MADETNYAGFQFSPAQTGWGIGAQAVGQALPSLINPYGNVGTNLGITLGGALLQGLLAYQARSEATDQSIMANRIATQMLAQPDPTARLGLVEALDDTAVQRRLLGLNERMLEQQIALNKEKTRIETLAPLEINVARAKELGVSLAELSKIDEDREEKRRALLGLPSKTDTTLLSTDATKSSSAQLLTSPDAYKYLTKPEREALQQQQKMSADKQQEVDTLRKEFNALPEVKDFSKVDLAAKVVAQAVQDPSSVATQELVRRAVQLIEPGMAVREGEQAAIANSQSIPQKYREELSRALYGTGGLSEETRAGIMRIAQRAYEAQSERYKVTKNYYEGLAKERNLPFKDIAYLGEPVSWTEISQSKTPNKQKMLQNIYNQLQTTTDPAQIAKLKQQAAAIYQGK